MDNDDAYTTEYNVGHTMGFGVTSGKWKAPDDTYPAFTPNYWQGGFSCFDCHSPHANPARMLGFNDQGDAVGLAAVESTTTGVKNGKVYGILNSGSGGTWDKALKAANNPQGIGNNKVINKPFWPSGTWLLIKNPDREIASRTVTVKSGIFKPKAGSSLDGNNGTDKELTLAQFIATIVEPDKDITITAGQEINDAVTEPLLEFDGITSYPVNKLPIDWNSPLGTVTKSLWRATNGGITATYGNSTGAAVGLITEKVRRADAQGAWSTTGLVPSGDYTEDGNSPCTVWTVSEFCTDCHDGNAGLHTVKAPLFSEDRALRNSTTGSGADGSTLNSRANYDLAYGHDAQPRHCGRQMVFNPEDDQDFGPHCRNCHKGSSRCSVCHDNTGAATDVSASIGTTANNAVNKSLYSMSRTTLVNTPTADNPLGSNRDLVSPSGASGLNSTLGYFQKSRTANWSTDWRNATGAVAMGKISGNVNCADDGFSWPHRTLGWKMLKDDLFGLNFNGTTVDVGGARSDGTTTHTAHDLDSVCLDCHNPTVWNATSSSDHTDDPTTSADDMDYDVLLRGLP
jgi:hypothetical protein